MSGRYLIFSTVFVVAASSLLIGCARGARPTATRVASPTVPAQANTPAPVVVATETTSPLSNAASSSQQPLAVTGLSAHSVGFVGCSNTEQAVEGYSKIPGNRNLFWSVQSYRTWGGTIDLWAQPQSTYWARFDQALQTNGQPKEIWVQLCEQYHARPVNFQAVQAMFTNLKQKAPNAVYFVSAINTYSPPNICPFMGSNGEGETDTQAWRDQLVSEGVAQRGPDMGPLTAQNTQGNDCHMDQQGMQLEGQELYDFFDKGK